MKKIYVIVMLLALVFSAKALEPYTLSKVIDAEGASKDQIYSSLKSWVGMSFVSAKAVIEVDDQEAGVFIIRPAVKYSKGGLTYIGFDGYLHYTLKFQARDGRFKVDLTNVTHSTLPGGCKDCAIELLTSDEEFPYKYAMGAKRTMNNVWKDMKGKVEAMANGYFDKLSELKIIDSYVDESDDW